MQPELPTGTVTFLFTDIEGSTRLLQELGDGYADAGQRRCRGRRVVSIDRSSYDRPTDD
jgi:class 3 adenylate cyclase